MSDNGYKIMDNYIHRPAIKVDVSPCTVDFGDKIEVYAIVGKPFVTGFWGDGIDKEKMSQDIQRAIIGAIKANGIQACGPERSDDGT